MNPFPHLHPPNEFFPRTDLQDWVYSQGHLFHHLLLTSDKKWHCSLPSLRVICTAPQSKLLGYDARNNSKHYYPCREINYFNVWVTYHLQAESCSLFLLSRELKEDLIKLSVARLLKISFEDSYSAIFWPRSWKKFKELNDFPLATFLLFLIKHLPG